MVFSPLVTEALCEGEPLATEASLCIVVLTKMYNVGRSVKMRLLLFSVMGGFAFVLNLETLQRFFFNDLGIAKQIDGINLIKVGILAS
ncbi:hypothetical protein AEQU3_03443 [Aequorivita antarctica]|nr:hypothetical protein AEQU3_03443 [Aequorivita antarctica]